MITKKEEVVQTKKALKAAILKTLSDAFRELEPLLGKKEFAKRVKKSVKLLTSGIKLKADKSNAATKKEKTTPDVKPETQPQKASQSANPAPKAVGDRSPVRKAPAKKAAPKKAPVKKAPLKKLIKRK